MLAWSVAQLALAVFAVFDRNADPITLLYVGEGCPGVFGVVQVADGQRMRLVAVPEFEATRRHQWLESRG